MEIEKIQMPKERAKEEWKLYNDLLKKRHDKYLEEMKKCMYQLSKGNELIDIYKVLEKVGLTKNYQPKIAIARADWKKVRFNKKDSGRGFFTKGSSSWYNRKDGDIDLPPETFAQWPRVKANRKEQGTDRTIEVDTWQIANEEIETAVPIIPASLTPDGDLKNYYILWEVFEWKDLPKKDDPLLLKRITENLFVILGAWDVTDLEQSIISGR